MDRALRLNLGANDRAFSGFTSVDIAPPADVVTDLAQAWPWETSSVDEVIASHVIEHIADRIHFMNELHRVMKPGARVTIATPNASKGSGFFQDPTHKAPWCLNSFQYFEAGSFAHQRLAKAYGITAAFRVLNLSESSYQERETVWLIEAVLEAVKSVV